jgi:hypothetical protein
MKLSKPVFTALTLTGLLGLNVTPGWTQAKSGEPSGGISSGGSQKEEGTSGAKRGGQMKSGDTAKGTESGDQASGKSKGEQWAKEDIKKVQEALKEKGNDPGPADGVMGPQTQKALRAFQSKNGLKTSGRLDAETAKALGVEKESSSMGKGSSSMERGSSSSKEPASAPMGKESSPKGK